MTKAELNKPEDIDKVRAEYDPVLGRDPWPIVMFYCGLKLTLKFFSLSGLFAMVATGVLMDIIDVGAEHKAALSLSTWYPWAFAMIAWLNWAARPQFKRLSNAVATYLENKK